MLRLRSILTVALALAYLIPAHLRGDDVVCVEKTGRVSFGCNEMIDTASYLSKSGAGWTTAPACGPCTDVQINWSAPESAVALAAPEITLPASALLVSVRSGKMVREICSSFDTGPAAALSNFTATSLRC